MEVREIWGIIEESCNKDDIASSKPHGRRTICVIDRALPKQRIILCRSCEILPYVEGRAIMTFKPKPRTLLEYLFGNPRLLPKEVY